METPHRKEHQDTSISPENIDQSLVTEPTDNLRCPPPYQQADPPAEYLETARIKLRDFGRNLTTALEKPTPAVNYAQKLILNAAAEVGVEKLRHSVRKRLVQYNSNNTSLERMKAHFMDNSKKLRKTERRAEIEARQRGRDFDDMFDKLESREDALVALAAAFHDYSKQFGPGVSISFKDEPDMPFDIEAASNSQAPGSDGVQRVNIEALLKSAQAAARVPQTPVLRMQRGALTFCMDGSEKPVGIKVDLKIRLPLQKRKRCSPTNDIWLALAEEDRDQL